MSAPRPVAAPGPDRTGDPAADPAVAAAADPAADGGADPVVAGGADPAADGGADPVVAGGADSAVGGGADSAVGGGADSAVGGGADSAVGGGADPAVGGGADPAVGGGVGPAEGRRELRGTARSGSVALLGAAVNGLLGFVLTVVIVRAFGPAGAGKLFTAIGVVSILGVLCCVGADTALVWSLSRRRRGPGGDAARLLPVALLPPLAVTAAVTATGILLAHRLAPRLFDGGGVGLLRLAFAALPAIVALTLLLAAVRAVRPVTAVVAVQYVLLPAARPVLVLAAAATGAGLVAAFAGWLLPVAAAVLVAAALLLRPLALTTRGVLRPVAADWRLIWRFALPRAASAAIDASSMWLTVVLTSALAGSAQAGIFGAAGRYALAGLLIMQGLRVAVGPQLSRLLGAARRADAAAIYRTVTICVIALSWPGYVLLATFAPGFLGLFGSGFPAGATALTLLAAAMLVNSGVGIVQTVLLMSGRSGRHLLATVAGLVLTVGFGVLLIPRHGAGGAALAWTAGIVTENVLAALAARAVLGVPLFDRPVALTAVLAGGGAAGLAAVAALLAGRGVPGLALAIALFAATAAVALANRRVRALARTAWSMIRPSRGGATP
ncbi:polysaccharide biosynthesis C-terminal domain-containing protein [Plantactinospora siamensis]|uniref:Polysaccharide biosynthesis C-terminal domain-containing protein n=1 Tax=Plantactinospora siamensis TaxID=555372 RepID=A0ABV6P699_9ACTN